MKETLVLDFLDILRNPKTLNNYSTKKLKSIAQEFNIDIIKYVEGDKYKHLFYEDGGELLYDLLEQCENINLIDYIKVNKMDLNILAEIIKHIIHYVEEMGLERASYLDLDLFLISIIEEINHYKLKTLLFRLAEEYYEVDFNKIINDIIAKQMVPIRDEYYYNFIENTKLFERYKYPIWDHMWKGGA